MRMTSIANHRLPSSPARREAGGARHSRGSCFQAQHKIGERPQRGFTLIELMIVLAILGILVAVALPAYDNHLVNARRADCMAALLGFAQAMERHRAIRHTYEGAGAAGADDDAPPSPAVYPAQCPLEGAPHYGLRLKAGTVAPAAYTLQAIPLPTSPQAPDGLLELDHLGQRFWDQNANGTLDPGENTWNRR